jgi:DNA-binding NarL/FixJ family response regulator
MHRTVLIWSNRPAFIRAMRSLAYREGLEVLGIARTPEAALRYVQIHQPHAVLVDRETEEHHPDTIVRLMVEGARTKVIAMDLADDAAIVLQGWRTRASTIRELMQVIEGSLASQAV